MLLRSSFGVDELFDMDIWEQMSICARDLAEDVQEWIDKGLIKGINPITIRSCSGWHGHAEIAHSYLVENRFTRDETIDALVTISMAMFDVYVK